MESNTFNSAHGRMSVTGEEKFFVPVSQFTIEPLPAGGTYALMVNKVVKGRTTPKKFDDIVADDYVTCENITVGLELYVSGVPSNYTFNICW